MKVQLGDACLSLQQVYEWTRKFMNGISSVTDSPRPGQAHRVVIPETIAAVEANVKENCHVTVCCMEHNGDYIKKRSHCVTFVFNKLRDKKYLRFSFDSPSYKECGSHVCSLVENYHDFGGTCCLYFVGRRMNCAEKTIQIKGKEKQEHRTE